jgi:hypothetical protein
MYEHYSCLVLNSPSLFVMIKQVSHQVDASAVLHSMAATRSRLGLQCLPGVRIDASVIEDLARELACSPSTVTTALQLQPDCVSDVALSHGYNAGAMRAAASAAAVAALTRSGSGSNNSSSMAVTSFLNGAGVSADDDTTSVTGSLLSASMRLNKAKKYLLRGGRGSVSECGDSPSAEQQQHDGDAIDKANVSSTRAAPVQVSVCVIHLVYQFIHVIVAVFMKVDSISSIAVILLHLFMRHFCAEHACSVLLCHC